MSVFNDADAPPGTQRMSNGGASAKLVSASIRKPPRHTMRPGCCAVIRDVEFGPAQHLPGAGDVEQIDLRINRHADTHVRSLG